MRLDRAPQLVLDARFAVQALDQPQCTEVFANQRKQMLVSRAQRLAERHRAAALAGVGDQHQHPRRHDDKRHARRQHECRKTRGGQRGQDRNARDDLVEGKTDTIRVRQQQIDVVGLAHRRQHAPIGTEQQFQRLDAQTIGHGVAELVAADDPGILNDRPQQDDTDKYREQRSQLYRKMQSRQGLRQQWGNAPSADRCEQGDKQHQPEAFGQRGQQHENQDQRDAPAQTAIAQQPGRFGEMSGGCSHALRGCMKGATNSRDVICDNHALHAELRPVTKST